MSILNTGLIIGAAVAISQQINSCSEEDLLKELKDNLAKDPKFIAKLNSLITGQPGQKGDKGDQGEAFEFEDFTPEQLDAIVSQAADLVIQNPLFTRVPSTVEGSYPGGVYVLKSTDTDLIIKSDDVTMIKLDATDTVARNVHFVNRKPNQVTVVVKDSAESTSTAFVVPAGSSRQFWVQGGNIL